ncbi:MAG: MFS transporter [Burkholderiales bacterium]|nr:MFS transporter [Burkholderiales bacterium]
MNAPHSLRAFRHRDYRLYFVGQGISQVGTWLQLVATSWLVYRLSESALMLGLASFALQIPFLVLAPLAGVLVDRLPKRRVLYFTQGTALAQSLAMFALVAAGRIEPWHLVAGNLLLGIVNAIDGPARQAMVLELVSGRREDLPNAIAFNSALMNGARFVGPIVGGAVIAALGEVWGFALNALSYGAVLVALARMRGAPRAVETGRESWLRQFAAGLGYAFGFLPTRAALLLLAAVSFSVQPYQSLAPYFAREVFGGDAHTLGLLIGAGGCGAVAGMIYLAVRPGVRGLLSLIPAAGAIAGAALIGFAACARLWLALPLLFLVGLGGMITAAGTNTVLQTIVAEHMRARVAALYMTAFLGTAPLGALAAGSLAERIGPPAALAAGGALALVAAAAYATRLAAIRRAIRPVYERLGILPADELKPPP